MVPEVFSPARHKQLPPCIEYEQMKDRSPAEEKALRGEGAVRADDFLQES